MFNRMFSKRNMNADGKDSIINIVPVTKKISKETYLISLVKANQSQATQILLEGINAANKHFVRSYSITIDNNMRRSILIHELLKNKKSLLQDNSSTLSIPIPKDTAEQFHSKMCDERDNLNSTNMRHQNYSAMTYPGIMTSYSWALDRLKKGFKDNADLAKRFENIPEKSECFKFDSSREDIWTYTHEKDKDIISTCNLSSCIR